MKDITFWRNQMVQGVVSSMQMDAEFMQEVAREYVQQHSDADVMDWFCTEDMSCSVHNHLEEEVN
jgi:hypothetical protein